MSQPPPRLITEEENRAWCIVYGIESAAVILGNLLVIAAFAVTKSLHKKTYLLLISLAVADLLVGAVAIPMFIHFIGGTVTKWWEVDSHVTHADCHRDLLFVRLHFLPRCHRLRKALRCIVTT